MLLDRVVPSTCAMGCGLSCGVGVDVEVTVCEFDLLKSPEIPRFMDGLSNAAATFFWTGILGVCDSIVGVVSFPTSVAAVFTIGGVGGGIEV